MIDKKMENNKLINISIIKVLMMFIIVLYHSMLFFTGKWFTVITPYHGISKICIILTSLFNTFHTQVFTMCSGFLFFYLRYNFNKYNNLKEDIHKKVKRLIVPYILFLFIYVVPVDCFFFGFNLKNIFINYVLGYSPSQLWFIPMLFLNFLFFYFFEKKIKMSTKNLIIIFFISKLLAFIIWKLNLNVFQLAEAARYSVFYYFGGFLYFNVKKITKFEISFSFIICLILTTIYLLVYNKSIKIVQMSLVLFKPFLALVITYTIYIIITQICNRKKNINIAFWNKLEKNGFGIYLMHQQVIYFIVYFLNERLPNILIIIISFVCSIIISYILLIIIRKIKPLKKIMTI